MDKWSKKYNQWFRCLESNRHENHKHLFRFKKYWWRDDLDIMIHEDIVDDYIEKLNRGKNKIKKDSYCIKNGIEIKNS